MTVRILLGKLDSKWTRTVRNVVRCDDELEIVGEGGDDLDLLIQADELHAHVVVLSQIPGGGEPGICSHLVLELPNVAVVLLPAEESGLIWRVVLRKQSWSVKSDDTLHLVLKAPTGHEHR